MTRTNKGSRPVTILQTKATVSHKQDTTRLKAMQLIKAIHNRAFLRPKAMLHHRKVIQMLLILLLKDMLRANLTRPNSGSSKSSSGISTKTRCSTSRLD